MEKGIPRSCFWPGILFGTPMASCGSIHQPGLPKLIATLQSSAARGSQKAFKNGAESSKNRPTFGPNPVATPVALLGSASCLPSFWRRRAGGTSHNDGPRSRQTKKFNSIRKRCKPQAIVPTPHAILEGVLWRSVEKRSPPLKP